MTSRIPLQIAAPTKKKSGHVRILAACALLTCATIGTTALWQGSAQAERPSSPAAIHPAQSIRSVAALSSVHDVQTELNRLRAEKRLPELVFDDWMLGPTAQTWAETMGAKGHVLHDPELAGDYEDNWKTLSESVAAGGSVDAALHTVLSNHLQASQLFSVDTTTAGVGMATVDDVTYLVVRFVA